MLSSETVPEVVVGTALTERVRRSKRPLPTISRAQDMRGLLTVLGGGAMRDLMVARVWGCRGSLAVQA
jgi:hypothetical protein